MTFNISFSGTALQSGSAKVTTGSGQVLRLATRVMFARSTVRWNVGFCDLLGFSCYGVYIHNLNIVSFSKQPKALIAAAAHIAALCYGKVQSTTTSYLPRVKWMSWHVPPTALISASTAAHLSEPEIRSFSPAREYVPSIIILVRVITLCLFVQPVYNNYNKEANGRLHSNFLRWPAGAKPSFIGDCMEQMRQTTMYWFI